MKGGNRRVRQKAAGSEGRSKGDNTKHRYGDNRDRERESGGFTAYNTEFVEFYRSQKIVPEGEWQEFMDALARPLPLTFRLCGPQTVADCNLEILRHRLTQAVDGHTLEALQELSRAFHSARGGTGWGDHTQDAPPSPPATPGYGEKAQCTEQSRPLAALQRVAWIPDRAWQLEAPSALFKKSAAFGPLREAITLMGDAGALSRQELVSMIPVQLLAIRPHHRVLDMCAAPGSKTRQILHALLFPADGGSRGGGARGVVVANDVNPQRCSTLVHQLRLSGMSKCIVTSFDARNFPSMDGKGAPGYFDRIVADVPCR